jgi:hypothetical protein
MIDRRGEYADDPRCRGHCGGYREFDETTLRSGGSFLIADSMYSISRAD